MYRLQWVYGTRSDVMHMRFVGLPLIPGLVDRKRYFPDPFAVAPLPEPERDRRLGAQPRRGGREVVPLAE